MWLHHLDIAGWLGAGGVLAAADPWEPAEAPIRNGNGGATPGKGGIAGTQCRALT